MTAENVMNPDTSEEDTILFRVDCGTIHSVVFDECETRAEYFDSEFYWSWDESPKAFVELLEFQPLMWMIKGLYCEVRDELVKALEKAKSADQVDTVHTTEIESKLAAMPSEPEEGVKQWLLGVDEDYFRQTIVERVKVWLSEGPEGDEWDFVSHQKSSDGDAFYYFSEVEPGSADLLSIETVEGAYPGSNYCCATLTISVDEANEISREEGLRERFVEIDS